MSTPTLTVPGYTILREIGQGGMANVYLARQDSLGREVALKVMKTQMLAGSDFASRFIKEGHFIARIQHPQIVTIYDLGTTDELYYFSMEYLPAGTLSGLIRKGLDPARARTIIIQIAAALGVAHEHGIIHRDIKPQNILLRGDGTPVLTDFGVARAAQPGTETMQLTSAGMVIGSPPYMSPEQSMGQTIDSRSDLYSLGVVFYEMLVGRLPYQAADLFGMAMQHCMAPIPRLPAGLALYQPIIDRLLAKKPDERFADARALIQALEALPRDPEPLPLSGDGEATCMVPAMAPPGVSPALAPDADAPTIAHTTGTLSLPQDAGATRVLAPDDQTRIDTSLVPPDDSGNGSENGSGAPMPRRAHRAMLASLATTLVLAAAGAGLYLAPADWRAVLTQPEPARPPETSGSPAPPPAPTRPLADPTPTEGDALAACAARFPEALILAGEQVAAAADCYRALPGRSADDPDLRARIARIETLTLQRLETLLAADDRNQAETALADLRNLRPDHPGMARFTEVLRNRRELSPALARIAGGCFDMGSADDEAGRETDERRHRVCVEAFALATHEVSVAEFTRFVNATSYRTDAEREVGGVSGCWAFDQDSPGAAWKYQAAATWRTPNRYQPGLPTHPVSCVSVNDAQAYLDWLNRETELQFRLPTEAEWEYAARAGTPTARFWGNATDSTACTYANVADTGSGWDDGFPCADRHEWVAPIGQFAPNAWGLRDMLGNLWEWTCSAYDETYQGAERTCAPIQVDGPRIMRGGAWNSGPALARVAYRNRNFPEARYSFVGFRIALDARARPEPATGASPR